MEKITQSTESIHAVELSVNLHLEFNLTKRKIIFGKNEQYIGIFDYHI